MAENLPVSLTAKNLYRLLTGKYQEFGGELLLNPDRKSTGTLIRFWWGFLSNIVPGDVLDPIFNAEAHRPRSLSNIMNRTITPSIPAVLMRAMDSNMHPDSFFGTIRWVMNELNSAPDPLHIHDILTSFEDACKEKDPLFAEQYPFFVSLRPAEQILQLRNMDRLFFQAALRITWLGIYATYGSEMSRPMLKKLRKDIAFDQHTLWYTNTLLLSSDMQDKTAKQTVHQTLQNLSFQSDFSTSAAKLLQSIRDLPTPEGSSAQDGWYVVANWTDGIVALNDAPCATYEGSNLYTTIENGTLLYITDANGYAGLHKSPNVWGHTVYEGFSGYVPMNLLVKLKM